MVNLQKRSDYDNIRTSEQVRCLFCWWTLAVLIVSH